MHNILHTMMSKTQLLSEIREKLHVSEVRCVSHMPQDKWC